MSDDLLISLARQALVLMLMLSLPPLLASLLIGVVFSLLQTVTQIQESAVTIVPKLLAALGALIVFGPWLGTSLAQFARNVLIAMDGVRL